MKRNVLFIIPLLLFCIGSSSAQIMSNGTGGGIWSSTTTWQGGVVPGATDDVVIAGTDSVAITAVTSCAGLTVQSGGKVRADQALTATSVTLAANAIFYNNSSATTPGSSTATYNLDNASTVVHMGSGTVGAGNNLTFGNLTIQRSGGTTAGGPLTINGNLTINNSSATTIFRGTNNTNGSQTHTVVGDVNILQGTLSCNDNTSTAGITCIWNIGGNVNLTGSNSRIGPISSGGSGGVGIININGNLNITNGGRLQYATSATTNTGIFNLAGNLNLSNAALNTSGTGIFAINFTGTGVQTVTVGQNIGYSTIFNDTVKAGASVVFDLGAFTWGPTGSGSGMFTVEGSLELKGNSTLVGPGAFELKNGGTLKVGSADGIALTGASGNIQVTGTSGRTFSTSGNYEYKGTAAQVTGSGLPSTVNHLTVNNALDVYLSGPVTVNGTLAVNNGDLLLNGNDVTIGPGGVLAETPGNTAGGPSGVITTTRTLLAPSGSDIAGLGVEITSSANLGSTTITRGHSAQTNGANNSIYRYFDISPANNSGLDATLVFKYDESELNSIAESNLILFKSTDAGTSWSGMGGIVNSLTNSITLSGIESFSRWTAGDASAPLPVQLSSFSASRIQNAVHVTWSTISELNNYGFEVQRSASSNTGFSSISQLIAGNGTTNQRHAYSYVDQSPLAGTSYYRLKQIDLDGSVQYTEPVSVESPTSVTETAPKVFALHQNYPNPFNPSTMIKFSVDQAASTTLRVFNMLGQEILTLFNGHAEPGKFYAINLNASQLPSGLYFYRLESAGKRSTKKMVLTR